MKKLIVFILALVCILSLVGCHSNQSAPDISENVATEMQEEKNTEVVESQAVVVTEEPIRIVPLPTSIDIAQLECGTVAISLEKGDFYTDDTGVLMMNATVFVYDLYDIVDVAMMKEGDIIVLCQNEVLVSSIERDENGCVLVNGGLDNGGFELQTDDDTVYYERGYSDAKSYYELGKVSLPVASDFVYTDTSDLDKDAVSMSAEDFIKSETDLDYYFNANNTTIQIDNGYVVAMMRVYTP